MAPTSASTFVLVCTWLLHGASSFRSESEDDTLVATKTPAPGDDQGWSCGCFGRPGHGGGPVLDLQAWFRQDALGQGTTNPAPSTREEKLQAAVAAGIVGDDVILAESRFTILSLGPSACTLEAYHTSIIMGGIEYFFSGDGGLGVTSYGSRPPCLALLANATTDPGPCPATHGADNFRDYTKTVMGKTPYSGPEFWNFFLGMVGDNAFGKDRYHLLGQNCNSFSDMALYYLLGKRMEPRYSQAERYALSCPTMFQQMAEKWVGPKHAYDAEAFTNKIDAQVLIPTGRS